MAESMFLLYVGVPCIPCMYAFYVGVQVHQRSTRHTRVWRRCLAALTIAAINVLAPFRRTSRDGSTRATERQGCKGKGLVFRDAKSSKQTCPNFQRPGQGSASRADQAPGPHSHSSVSALSTSPMCLSWISSRVYVACELYEGRARVAQVTSRKCWWKGGFLSTPSVEGSTSPWQQLRRFEHRRHGRCGRRRRKERVCTDRLFQTCPGYLPSSIYTHTHTHTHKCR
jgi:hypothetical protein